jgi:predicted DNA-binding transcriptional regulator YafY
MLEYILNHAKDKDCDIIYMSGDEITQRRIHIYKVENDYIKAFCYQRGDMRTFRKDKILSAALASTEFTRQ